MPMPGIKCPKCAAQGEEVWVIPGKNCHNRPETLHHLPGENTQLLGTGKDQALFTYPTWIVSSLAAILPLHTPFSSGGLVDGRIDREKWKRHPKPSGGELLGSWLGSTVELEEEERSSCTIGNRGK
ncbi:hypothetical protein BO70DRAFT_392082 [Aspergillus heteromorphus CBS 117.55]|uniref:Uncharacterized protein n=1 Tax=Aspergillus heteromorphus CBS 117.55 TaxID=1448321 RepID=A0A317X242_9EURO|nr:uncharacterized protein BO70DRAFT_392082 [Aspergillus heteromorphus CBS 117.55]PWY92694.1 hypothetical protein BO70DRAFT_392082 [Aspergillus heteromorphus CBS 117.55]